MLLLIGITSASERVMSLLRAMLVEPIEVLMAFRSSASLLTTNWLGAPDVKEEMSLSTDAKQSETISVAKRANTNICLCRA